MDHSSNLATGKPDAAHRRARSASQPVHPPHSDPGSSNPRIPELDFSFMNQFAGPSATPMLSAPPTATGYDEDALARALRALQEIPPPPPLVPQIPAPQMINPQLTEAFLAALPWLQYLQIQQQYIQQPQQSHQQHHSQQQNSFPFMPPPAPAPTPVQSPSSFNFGSGHFGINTPSPEADAPEPSEADQTVVVEDKRRRNTAASARFRIKKKQWTLNLERTISDLSGRVEELEREASELRRENGWLKEIVMLKSKRFAGVVPNLEEPSSSSAPLSLEGTVMSFGRPPSVSTGFKVTPPDRGSFPLDHDGECKEFMKVYLDCLRKNTNNSTPCRLLNRDYLDCRMSHGLMTRDDWKNLGLNGVEKADEGAVKDNPKNRPKASL
ncbi:hypothetical protein A0H81_00385 [Grifola frondosa]|uniref:BZIP domain-containing protein n=1 Tax=Grifola frondosa TaxID=5627 RepID=A0A1C7MQW7_GRIFR|nr:hypothetical protein A0H81_00385 [Grifola frondosa]